MRGTGLLGVVAVDAGRDADGAAFVLDDSVGVSEAEAREEATKAIALLQQSMTTRESKRSCASCHHQHLPSAAADGATARCPSTSRRAEHRRAWPKRRRTRLRRPGGYVGPPARVDSARGRNAGQRHRAQATLACRSSPANPYSSVTRWSNWGPSTCPPNRSPTASRRCRRSPRDQRHAGIDETRGAAPRRSGPRAAEKVVPADTKSARCSFWACRARAPRRTPSPRRNGRWWPRSAPMAPGAAATDGSDAYATGPALVVLQRAGGLRPKPSVGRRGGLAYRLLNGARMVLLVDTDMDQQGLPASGFRTAFLHGVASDRPGDGHDVGGDGVVESLLYAWRMPWCSIVLPWTCRPSGHGCRRCCWGTTRKLRVVGPEGLDVDNSRTPKGARRGSTMVEPTRARSLLLALACMFGAVRRTT